MNRDEYRRMYEHENNHWWYRGMRTIAGSMLNDSLVRDHAATPKNRAPHPPVLDGSRIARSPAAQATPSNGGLPWQLDILDAGCGTGAGLEWLSQYGTATGIDLSEDALAFSKQRGLQRLIRASVETLPFPEESFDLVTSFDVLYHLWVADASQSLREFHRVLRPGGRLLIRLPALGWLQGKHDVAVHTRHRYHLGEVVDEMCRTGFSIERATYVNMLLLPLVAGKRVTERWAASAPGDLDATPPWLNQLLADVLGLEGRLVRRVRLPLGVSVMALGRRTP